MQTALSMHFEKSRSSANSAHRNISAFNVDSQTAAAANYMMRRSSLPAEGVSGNEVIMDGYSGVTMPMDNTGAKAPAQNEFIRVQEAKESEQRDEASAAE